MRERITWTGKRAAEVEAQLKEQLKPIRESQARYFEIANAIGLSPLWDNYGSVETMQKPGAADTPTIFILTDRSLGPLDGTIRTEGLDYPKDSDTVNQHLLQTLRIFRAWDTPKFDSWTFFAGFFPYLPVHVLPFPDMTLVDGRWVAQDYSGNFEALADNIGQPDYPVRVGDIVYADAASPFYGKAGTGWENIRRDGPMDAWPQYSPHVKRLTDAGVHVVLPSGNSSGMWQAYDDTIYQKFIPDDYGQDTSGAIVVATAQKNYDGDTLSVRPNMDRLVAAPTRVPCGAPSPSYLGWPVGTSWSGPLVAGSLGVIAHLYRQITGGVLTPNRVILEIPMALDMQAEDWKQKKAVPMGRKWDAYRMLHRLLFKQRGGNGRWNQT